MDLPTHYICRYVEPLLKVLSCLNIAILFPIGQPQAARGEVEADNAAVLTRRNKTRYLAAKVLQLFPHHRTGNTTPIDS